MDLFTTWEHENGFLARRDLLDIGFDDRFIQRQIEGGRWVRIRNGAYAVSDTWRDLDPVERHRRHARAVLRAHGDGVVLSKVSALAFRPGVDLWDVDLSRVHVTRRDSRSGSLHRDVVHYEGPIPDEDVELVDDVPLQTESRSLVETIATLSVEQGLVIADSALRAGRVERGDLETLVASRARRRGNRRLDLVLRLADGRAESVGESRSRYLFWSHGLPHPEVQYEVRDTDGRLVGYTDLALPAHGVLYEFDGRVKYGRFLQPGQEPGDAVFAEKRREDDLRRVTGFSVVRCTWSDLSRPALVAHRIREQMRGFRPA